MKSNDKLFLKEKRKLIFSNFSKFISLKKKEIYFTDGRNAVRRKNALHDSQEIASKLYPN
jgi:hypothetical protein